jgi:hypothetical protein
MADEHPIFPFHPRMSYEFPFSATGHPEFQFAVAARTDEKQLGRERPDQAVARARYHSAGGFDRSYDGTGRL